MLTAITLIENILISGWLQRGKGEAFVAVQFRLMYGKLMVLGRSNDASWEIYEAHVEAVSSRVHKESYLNC